MKRLLISLLLLATSVRAGERIEDRIDQGQPRPGSAIVEFHPLATVEQFRHDLGSIDTRAGKNALPAIRHTYRHVLSGVAVDLADEAALDAVRQLPYVLAVHPNRIVKMYASPSATAAAIDAAARVNATSLGTRGEGMRIGIIDSGVDYMHPALGGGFGAGYKVAGGWDFVGDDANPADEHGHGTHVAGIIAADSPELAGVAPGATLYAYRVLNAMGFGDEADIIAAIERSMDPNQDGNRSDHLDVINISLGAPGTADDLASRAVDRATAAGVVVVVAAGNEGVFASIGSPGTARTAITVGAIDDAGVVTQFSSRGPSSLHLELKPDVVAPGYAIASARMGGGLIAMNGTSMSAPHVAGAAALLVKLHPDWTPADVKSALVTSASPVNGTLVERAAGRVDAGAATWRTVFAGGGAVSFGLAPGRTGTSSATRTVKLTNRGTAAQTYEVVATNVPGGATLTATPATVQLAPGATQSVSLRLDLDNAAVAFPSDFVHGGSVEFRGAETLKLPWMVVRAGRITARFVGGGQNLRAISSTGPVGALMYDRERGEIFGMTGTKWDVVMTTYQTDEDGFPNASQIVFFEDREMTGDTELLMRRSDASLRFRVDGRDVAGANLNRQARAAKTPYSLVLAIDYTKGPQELELGYLMGPGVELSITPLSSSFVIHAIEAYADMTRRETYNVQHPPLHGLSESKRLTADRSSYVHARLRFNEQRTPDYLFAPCLAYGVQESGFLDLHSLGCPGNYISEPFEIAHYTTSESGTAASGLIVGTSDMVLSTVRGVDGAIVVAEFSVSPAAYRIQDGERITVGGQAWFPLSFFGTNGGRAPKFLEIRTGLTGSLGDWHWAMTNGTLWAMTRADDSLIASGTLVSPQQIAPPPAPGGRLMASRDGLTVGGQPSRGELEVRFGTSGLDFRAPTLTTFRIVDSAGRLGDTMRLDDPVRLEFSVADWDLTDNTVTQPLKREATRVWYRAHGTTEWLPAPVVLAGEDNGSFDTLGRIPAGDIFRADLSAATANAGGVDVRVQTEDADGNQATWSQSPAFVVNAGKGRARRLR